MEPVPSFVGQAPTKQVADIGDPTRPGELPPSRHLYRPLYKGKPDRKAGYLSLALLGAGALCLPLLGGVALAADTDGTNSTATAATQSGTAKSESTVPAAESISPAEAQSLREEVRELREELKAVKGATATNSETLKIVSQKVDDTASHAEVEEVRDLEDENVLRSIGGTSSLNSYQVGGIGGGPGYLHLLNLSGFAQLGYTSLLGKNPNQPTQANQSTTQESFKLSSVSLTLSGYARQDPGAEGDVRFNVGVLATPNRYVASANTSLSAANATPTGTANGSYLNASDVWAAYDVKTTKLELEPAWTLSIQAGQFLVPYGVDNPSTENNRPTINQAQYISKLGFGRDIGVDFTGGIDNRNDPSASTIPLIGYNFGVFNGSGPNTFANNNSVEALARLTYSPFYQYAANFRNLQFAANILDANLGPTEGNLPRKLRYGGDIQWLRKPFLLTAEYVHSEDGYHGYSTNLLAGSSTLSQTPYKSDSYVGTLFWTPPTLPDYQPWIRVDRFEPAAFKDYSGTAPKQPLWNANSLGYGNIERTAYSIGFNWFIWQKNPVTRLSYASMQTERVLKLQVDYTYYDQSHYTSLLPQNQIDVLLTLNF
jgi:uncharacterized membrane protein